MRLTKVDNVSHYKTQKNGKLKFYKKKKELETEKIILKRFNEQIESRLYKEFFSITKNGEKIRAREIEDEKDLSLSALDHFHFLLKELYTEDNLKWNKNKILEIQLDDKNKEYLRKLENDESLKMKKSYKLKEGNYLYNCDNQKTFIELFKNFQLELKDNLDSDVRKLTSFNDMKEEFKKYKERKLELILKSINNNKITLAFEDEKLKSDTIKESYFINIFKELVEDAKEEKNTIENKINSNFDNEMKSFFLKIKSIFKEEKNDIRINIFQLTRELVKKYKKENDINKIGKWIYIEEIKKYIENNFSINKKKNKGEKGENKEDLYLKYLKKVFFLKENLSDEEYIEKIKKKIFENFKNRLFSHILEYGKYCYHLETDTFLEKKIEKTEDLEYLKAKESLTNKMATLVSFAAQNFNQLRKEETPVDFNQDITGIKLSLFDLNYTNPKKLAYFFDFEFDKNNIEHQNFLKMVHEVLTNMRHNIVHYKKEDISPKEFQEYTKNNNSNDKVETFSQKYLENKLNELQDKLLERFSSNNLNFYYEENEINNYFEVYNFYITKKTIPFAPQFKRILEKGEKLYKFNKENYKYFWNLLEGEVVTEEYNEAKKAKNFLLKELYYNNFYSEFLENNIEIETAIIAAKFRKNAQREKENAYSQFDDYENYSNLEEYIANIHKIEMNKINIAGKANKAEYVNEYLEDIFLEAFVKWLNNKESLKFLEKNFTKVIELKNRKNFNNSIKIFPEMDKVKVNLNLFLFFNLIDNKRISEFKNELIKYEQFLKTKNLKNDKTFLGIDIEEYKIMCEITPILKERLDTRKELDIKNKEEYNNKLFYKYYSDIDEYNQILNKFIVVKRVTEITKDNIYYSSDNKTPILFSNLEKTRKNGTLILIAEALEDYKYTSKNAVEFEKLKLRIEELQKEKTKLHKIWVKKKKLQKEEKERYEKCCKDIRKYNYLKEKQTLQTIYKLHEIITDIQAREIAFINKYERDFKYLTYTLLKFLPSNSGLKDFLKNKKGHFSISKWQEIIEKDIELKNINKNLIEKIFSFDTNYLRNYIAHFHHFTDFIIENKNNRATRSFVDQMNLLIELFNYDKKIKNHINKSYKTILEKYNISLEFKFDENKKNYQIKSVKSLRGKILGEKKFELLENEFLKMVRQLLEYKKFI